MRGVSWQESLTRVVVIVCGAIAAVLLIRNGAAEALPAIAVGGSIGACLMRTFEDDEQ